MYRKYKLRLARMEVNCNLKNLANFFKFFLCILEKSLKTDKSSFFLGENLNIFKFFLCILEKSLKTDYSSFSLEENLNIFRLLGVVRAIHVQTRFFVKYLGTLTKMAVTVPL